MVQVAKAVVTCEILQRASHSTRNRPLPICNMRSRDAKNALNVSTDVLFTTA